MSQLSIYTWQSSQFEILQTAFVQQRMPHAMLFSGVEGIGKHHFAKALGQGLLCLNPEGLRACDVCKSCLLFTAQSHPDFLTLQPEDVGKQIKIDDVRNAKQQMDKTSQQGGAKVLLIDPAEAMNESATNALLKTLEEPSERSYLLLVSHSHTRLLPTIRSRCQRYDFKVPSFAEAKEWLAQTSDQTAQKLDEALLLASNRPLLAETLLSSPSIGLRVEVRQDLLSLLNGQVDFLSLVSRWKQYDFELLIQYLCMLLLDLSKLTIMGEEASQGQLQDPQVTLFHDQLRKSPHAKRLFVLYEKVLEVKEQGLSKANINRELLIENLLLQWQACLG